ncbi:uncharacterized protein LOC118936143 [Manis pentadactyla]|uniref:uncharacterized protein LOC118936143 n=1 Tax=Manis pentadactyla TaxID=143292 RepID=UPI00255C99BC|nr:uncharacterized protein LOC118936143 [Manis pentadactyla]
MILITKSVHGTSGFEQPKVFSEEERGCIQRGRNRVFCPGDTTASHVPPHRRIIITPTSEQGAFGLSRESPTPPPGLTRCGAKPVNPASPPAQLPSRGAAPDSRRAPPLPTAPEQRSPPTLNPPHSFYFFRPTWTRKTIRQPPVTHVGRGPKERPPHLIQTPRLATPRNPCAKTQDPEANPGSSNARHRRRQPPIRGSHTLAWRRRGAEPRRSRGRAFETSALEKALSALVYLEVSSVFSFSDPLLDPFVDRKLRVADSTSPTSDRERRKGLHPTDISTGSCFVSAELDPASLESWAE